jgi:hypothetical protein
MKRLPKSMGLKNKVFWTHQAVKDLQSVIQYLNDNWDEMVFEYVQRKTEQDNQNFSNVSSFRSLVSG